jgi:hypothetical protein
MHAAAASCLVRVNEVLTTLVEPLDGEVRVLVRRRFDDMRRQLGYLREKDHPALRMVRKRGWAVDRLEVVLALNSFYQVVLAPLASSGRNYRDRELGSSIPVVYGDSMRFDRSWGERITSVYDAFKEVTFQFDIRESYLTAQHTDDVVFRINRDLNDDE